MFLRAVAFWCLVGVVMVQGPEDTHNTTQKQKTHTYISYYFTERGFDVLPAVPGRRATFPD